MCLRWSRRPQPGTPRHDGIRTAPHPRVPPSSPKPPQSLPYPPHPQRAPPPPPPPSPPPLLENDSSMDSEGMSSPNRQSQHPTGLVINPEYIYEPLLTVSPFSDEDKVLELYSVLCGPMTRTRAKPQPLLRPPSGPIHRESTLAFRFKIGEGTFFKMPEEISQYEEILSARGFTLHHEYFVDETMARLLIARVGVPPPPLSCRFSFSVVS